MVDENRIVLQGCIFTVLVSLQGGKLHGKNGQSFMFQSLALNVGGFPVPDDVQMPGLVVHRCCMSFCVLCNRQYGHV